MGRAGIKRPRSRGRGESGAGQNRFAAGEVVGYGHGFRDVVAD